MLRPEPEEKSARNAEKKTEKTDGKLSRQSSINVSVIHPAFHHHQDAAAGGDGDLLLFPFVADADGEGVADRQVPALILGAGDGGGTGVREAEHGKGITGAAGEGQAAVPEDPRFRILAAEPDGSPAFRRVSACLDIGEGVVQPAAEGTGDGDFAAALRQGLFHREHRVRGSRGVHLDGHGRGV